MADKSESLLVRAVAHLERARGLDGAIRALAPKVRRAPQAVLDLLHGAPLGHAVHPVAVLVPAGAWISASVLDFLPGSERAARRLVAVGLLSAAPTSASGLADWSSLNTPQQRVGIVHASANVLAWFLYAASWLQRRKGNDGRGKLLALAALGVLGGSGYLGGHLVYRQGARVETRSTSS
ncbi:DUF2231 domain-containing protein [Naasia lichenicola]|uniref:DUF2231 domain-containing protein n=1 Tax=Naasia lichenicola TaxID=2565933 RepID=A0A4V3WSZ2_9MICO|nr:DUF2231 domain-containing protein [Naasia lichenicola]THG29987.1 DUF2231 domain-containing protein [Naasia lichenicola]